MSIGMRCVSSAIVSGALFAGCSLYGPAAAADEQADTLQEVVVTALRRDTTLQTTPLSVTAITGAVLAKDNIQDMADLTATVPSFSVEDNGPGERRPIIRGIQGAGEPQVGIYYDDFPITGTPGATNDAGRFAPDLKMYDIDRIEVLKGPQGTLFGSGSMGGTLRYITKQPDLNEWGGYFESGATDITDGGFGGGVDSVINIPVIQDRLGVRLLAYEQNVPGYIDNVALGVKNINHGLVDGGRLSVLFQPTDQLTFSAIGIYQNARYNAGSGAVASLGDLKSDYAIYDPLNDRDELYGLTGSYNMGFATLTASASYFKRELLFTFPFAGLPIPFTSPTELGTAIIEQPQTANSETYEARLTSNGSSPLVWTLGVFDQQRSADLQSVIPFAGPTGVVDPAYPLFQNRFVSSYLDQTAIFGDAAYTFVDKLTLTLGARYFDYRVGDTSTTPINEGGSPGSDTPVSAQFKASSWVPKVNLSFQATPDALVYAQYNEGYRPGGANQRTEPVVPAGYGSDSVKNYEIGAKSEWLDRRLTANAAVYHEIWNKIQVSGVTPDGLFDYTTNAGQALVDGAELELSAAINRNWSAGISFGYTDARLSEDQPFLPGVPRLGLTGNRIPAVPSSTDNVYTEYRFPVAALQGAVRANYKYVGASQNEFNPDLISPTTGTPTGTADPFFARMRAYSAVNLSADLGKADRWKLTLFTDNLFDARGETFILIDTFHPSPGSTFYIQPRTVGIRMTADF